MLTFEKKLTLFTSILSQDEISYADSFNGEILIYAENFDFKFLNKLETVDHIKSWITLLKGQLVMKEDEASIQDIIYDYIDAS